MLRLPERPDLGLLLLRLAAGGLMIVHGVQKLSAWPGIAERFPDPIGLGSGTSAALAIFAEVFCAGLVAAGALTRVALVPLIVTMLVALFVVHGSDPWGRKELAAVYLAMYVVLLVAGPGRYSVDAWWRDRAAGGDAVAGGAAS